MNAIVLTILIWLLDCDTLVAEYKRDKQNEESVHPEGKNGGSSHGNGSSSPVPQRCRHNYHDSTELGMNRQINMFLQAGLVYDSMSQFFGRCDVALPGFAKFFDQLSTKQYENAHKMQKYQNMRGGVVLLQPVTTPATADWGDGLEAMSHALEMEKSINAALLELHILCTRLSDPHAGGFVQTLFLGPQVEKIYTLSQYIANLERVGPGIGEYLFDKFPQT